MMPYSSDIIVFDLDDTLYKEIDFVKSGFAYIAHSMAIPYIADELITQWRNGTNAFQFIIDKHNLKISVSELLDIYRHHIPSISIEHSVAETLDYLIPNNKILGIISDGRSITQRNKIEALGLYKWIAPDKVIISEEFGSPKPDPRNYQFFMNKYPYRSYTYIGDNLLKDFITPNKLSWQTICIKDNGQNIHSQDLEVENQYAPQKTVKFISEII